jgi:hypothetical protein
MEARQNRNIGNRYKLAEMILSRLLLSSSLAYASTLNHEIVFVDLKTLRGSLKLDSLLLSKPELFTSDDEVDSINERATLLSSES